MPKTAKKFTNSKKNNKIFAIEKKASESKNPKSLMEIYAMKKKNAFNVLLNDVASNSIYKVDRQAGRKANQWFNNF